MAEVRISDEELDALAQSLARVGEGGFTSSELSIVTRWMQEERAGPVMLAKIVSGELDVAVRNGVLVFLVAK